MATNPYSALTDLAKSQYSKTDKASQNYYADAKKSIQDTTKQSIAEINQKIQQAQNSAIAEGRASYSDYLKSINPYGAGADNRASAGLGGSGYSETSKMMNYNSMQNRIASAKATASQSMQEYNNQIAQARNQQNADLAELAYNTMTARANASNNYLNNRLNIASGYTNYVNDERNYNLSKQSLSLGKSKASSSKASSKSSSKTTKKTSSTNKTSSSKSNTMKI